METTAERLEYVKRQLNLTYTDIASLLGQGLNANSVGTAFRRNNLKPYYVNVLCDKLFINKEWLNTGEGEVFTKKVTSNDVKQISLEEFMEAKYLPVKTQAGYLSSLDAVTHIELQTILVPKEYDNGNFLVVEVEGTSMDDNTRSGICDGDKLLIKEWEGTPTDRLPIRNNLFVIASKDGLVCKQIIEHDHENGVITCHSFNPTHSDYKINLSDVYKIFLVRKIVDRRIKF